MAGIRLPATADFARDVNTRTRRIIIQLKPNPKASAAYLRGVQRVIEGVLGVYEVSADSPGVIVVTIDRDSTRSLREVLGAIASIANIELVAKPPAR